MCVVPSALLAMGACIQSAPPAHCPPSPSGYPPPPPSSGPTPAPAEAFPPEYVGYYDSSEWGAMMIRSLGDGRVRATYSHDEGTVEGYWVGNTIVGWWCEAPSRAPDKDAGEVELTFINEGGVVRIDGRWRYGTAANEPEWRENWDVTRRSNDPPSPELLARFDDESAFCARPAY
jgi:hypothetical protein